MKKPLTMDLECGSLAQLKFHLTMNTSIRWPMPFTKWKALVSVYSFVLSVIINSNEPLVFTPLFVKSSKQQVHSQRSLQSKSWQSKATQCMVGRRGGGVGVGNAIESPLVTLSLLLSLFFFFLQSNFSSVAMTRSGLSLEELRIVEGQGQSSEVITPPEEINRMTDLGQ